MIHYLGLNFEDFKESTIADVKSDGELQNVFIEERYTREKYCGTFPLISMFKTFFDRDDDFKVIEDDKFEFEKFEKIFKKINYVKTKTSSHHLYHAYESFYTSGFDHAAILVIDGYRENRKLLLTESESITLYLKRGKDIKVLCKYSTPYSLGLFYHMACMSLGFSDNEEEQFMNLSVYGEPFEDRMLSIKNGELQYFCDEEEMAKHYKVDKESLNLINSINYAATVQRDLSECVLELVKNIKKMTNEENLCLSGGIFNNAIINNLICESGIFKNVWCSPAPGDFGLSIGKAYLAYETDSEKINFHKLNTVYKGMGTEYNDDNIFLFFNNRSIEYSEISYKDIVNKLCEGKVLAWFQGASEFGRKALGHRCLIANPEYPYMYEKVSRKIKGNAPYIPLACTVPDELFDLMFDVKNKDLTEYMLRAIPIRSEMKAKVLACTHIDGTTRPQRLRREVNQEFYDMIMEFYKKTGIPCVINTNLSGKNESIVESLNDLILFLHKHQKVDGAVINGKYYVANFKFYLESLLD